MVVTKLKVQVYAGQRKIIRYGSKSTQITHKKARMDFGFNQGHDNSIILGMDWMYEEDVVLRVKQKSVIKTAKV
ncbi:hypothetical protein A0J61_11400 [Choanephora cucurbitarum]|uniref:Uncharacterized protein n=1 Tax=Choanephora cucurbitarum TaxID=101091 RepID=A0A1C7MUP7_9FUNG|nr:hypothetical protein A0J61_11400 [Choanephora cucurbitarum]